MSLTLLAACSHASSNDTAASPTPAAATPAVSPAPLGSSATVAATPAAQTARSSPLPAPAMTAGPSASPDPPAVATGPRIISVSVAPSVVHPGDTVKWDVRTSLDIASVTARTAVYKFTFDKRGPGRFALNFTIPANVPPMFHGHYALTVTATTAAGASASKTVGLSFE